jgi:hypothetical protein
MQRCPKSVVLSNWYYDECYGGFDLATNKTADHKRLINFWDLEKAGYDQLPCTSSYQCEPSADAVVKFCRERIAPERLKGFLMAPWTLTTPDKANKISRSIELIAASKNKYYP